MADGLYAELTHCELRFVLHRKQPLKLKLTVESAQESLFELKLNESLLGELSAGPTPLSHSLELPIRFQQRARNVLSLEGAPGVIVRDCEITPRNQSQLQDGRLQIPFGGSVSYSLEAQESSVLALQIEEWSEPGGPPLEDQSWWLEVKVLGDQSPPQSLGRLGKFGSHRLALPSSTTGSNLVIEAHSKDTPSGGNRGLTLGTLKLRGMQPVIPSKSSTGPTKTPPANVIIYLVDTLRADHLGCYGGSVATPAVDALAKEGILFENALAQAPWTKASVASLFSGRYPSSTGLNDFADVLSPELVTLAELFGQGGYETAAFTTNPLLEPGAGFEQGFESFHLLKAATKAREMNAAIFDLLDNRITERPLFLYVHTLEPHIPYDPPAEFKGPHQSLTAEELSQLRPKLWNAQRRGQKPPLSETEQARIRGLYQGEVLSSDLAFGAFVAGLKERGLYQDSVIVFLSDHGEELLEHGYLEHLNAIYEESLRVPLILRPPVKWKLEPRRVTNPIGLLDVAPTLLDWCGLPSPPDCQGQAYNPGRAWPLRPVFFEAKGGQDNSPTGVVRDQDLLGVRQGTWVLLRARACIGRWLPALELFDLTADPQQQQDLSSELPATLLRLESLLNQHEASMVSAPVGKKLEKEHLIKALLDLQYLR